VARDHGIRRELAGCEAVGDSLRSNTGALHGRVGAGGETMNRRRGCG